MNKVDISEDIKEEIEGFLLSDFSIKEVDDKWYFFFCDDNAYLHAEQIIAPLKNKSLPFDFKVTDGNYRKNGTGLSQTEVSSWFFRNAGVKSYLNRESCIQQLLGKLWNDHYRREWAIGMQKEAHKFRVMQKSKK